jgi:hypothetical protein
VPPGTAVRPASHTDVRKLFAKDPDAVIVGGDSVEFHQYVWELKNWQDGKRVTTDAPAAFWLTSGRIRVHPGLWEKEGGRVSEILTPESPARSTPNELEIAPTLPGGPGGVGSTNASIAPGKRRP